MPLDPSIPALAALPAALSLDQVDLLQVSILVYLYHKEAATSTAILNFVNTIERHTGRPLRTQSAISHSLSRLAEKNPVAFIHRDKGTGHYRNTIHGYDIAAAFLRRTDFLEKAYAYLQTIPHKTQSVHVE